MKKEGIGHIEMILAFLIFVSSIMFIFYYFNVGNVTKNNDAMLAFLELEIAKKVKIDVTTATFVINSTFTQTLGDPGIVLLQLPEELPAEQGVRAEAYDRTKLKSSIDQNRKIIYVDRTLLPGSSKSNFVRIVSSKDTPSEDQISSTARAPQAGTPPALLPAIIPSSIDTKKMYSEKQLKDLKASYNYNYIAQRKTLKLSDRVDFSFKIALPEIGGGETLINAESPIPSGVPISALNRRVEVLRSLDGSRVFANFGIRVW